MGRRQCLGQALRGRWTQMCRGDAKGCPGVGSACGKAWRWSRLGCVHGKEYCVVCAGECGEVEMENSAGKVS